MIVYILNIVLGILLIYLLINSFYNLLFGLASALKPKQHTPITHSKKHRIAVFIPGYKEDGVIVPVAQKALEQDYDSEYYQVVVLADSFEEETLEKLYKMPITTVVVEFEKSTKSKALRAGMKHMGDNWDIALVLDADNIMAPDFLSKINEAYNQGYEVVQGHRVAKNLNSSYALLDAASEEINNSIFRKGHRALGLSSALIGSGMAFNYKLFKDFMANVNAIGGFDKELELKLNRDKIPIQYLNDALVYDEKVQDKAVFENQRKRWLSAQFIYFGRFIFPALWHLVSRLNISFFDKAFQLALLPRVLNLGLSVILWLFSLFYFLVDLGQPFLANASIKWWSLNLLAVVLALALSLPKKMYNAQLFKAVWALPQAILTMFALLFKLKGANKKFIHTQHKHVEEDLPK